jgi:CRP-like cAMP-binding protein
LFGLSEQGRYTNSAKAITPVTAYALPVPALRRQLSKDAALDFHLIAKLSHALREAQRHALLLPQRHASSKLAIFLQLQEHVQSTNGPLPEIYLRWTARTSPTMSACRWRRRAGAFATWRRSVSFDCGTAGT